LITGPSGIGKSELLLALIDRGHQLVSDDVTLIHRCQQQIIGCAPEQLAGMMQIHGCGLFSVKDLFGHKGYLASKQLQFIVDLDPTIKLEKDPLEASRSPISLLGIDIPRVIIPMPGPRNLPLVIELLVRKEITEK